MGGDEEGEAAALRKGPARPIFKGEPLVGTRLIAIGNALMDLIAFVDAEVPASMGFRVNATSHLESGMLDPLLPRLSGASLTAAGGAANTARAAALLGMEACFVGTIGDDEMGARYERDLSASGVETILRRLPLPTGLFCALVHPDGGRTILVAPGAAPSVGELRGDFERRSGDILYIDGFAIANSCLLEEEGAKAKAAGMRVAIDLGSKFLVESRKNVFLEGIPRYCDFVFANEDEFKSLTGSSVEDGCEALAGFDCSFIVKRGEKGAIHCWRGQVLESPVRAQLPFDETGAGDAFAAGFLVGISRGFLPERCLRLGNRIAEEAIAVPGLGIDPARIGIVLAAAGL